MMWRICASIVLLYLCQIGTGVAYAAQHYELAREKGEKFVKAYLAVDKTLMDGTGKSQELLQSMEYANARLKHDEFVEFWSDIIEMECLPTAMDLRTKVKTDVKYEWIHRYSSACYQKFILFHWDEINGSIDKRNSQVRSEEFLEDGRVRH